MAKKSKPEKQTKEQNDNSQASHKRTIKSGLMTIMLPSLIGSAIVAAVCGALMMFLVIQPASNKQRNRDKPHLRHQLHCTGLRRGEPSKRQQSVK